MKDDREQDDKPHGMALDDIYFVLFRQKWTIILFSAIGVLGAVAVFAIKPPRYRSEAKLYIRYVAQAKALTPPGSDAPTRSPEGEGASILKTEAQILKSLDVAQQVVETVGADKILGEGGGNTNRDQAAGRVLGMMEVVPSPDGSVISVFYEHPDPEVTREVLRKVIVAYVKKHKEMHQTAGIFGDFVSQETERLRTDLAQTEKELRAAKSKAGVTSLEDAKRAWTEQISRVRGDLFSAQAELAERQARLEETTGLVPASLEATNTEPQIPSEQVKEYKTICARLDRLTQKEQELLVQFTENTSLVREVREQIAGTERRKQELEEMHPRLASLANSSPRFGGPSGGISVDPSSDLVQVKALKLKIEVLNSQLAKIQAEATKLEELEGPIQELQRKKELQEADLKYFSANLDQSRIEDALGSGKAPNIGILQSPSPPVMGWSKPFKKKVTMLAVIPAVCGVALAFLIELFLDRSVKRPGEVETKLQLPLFISIPDLRRNGNRLLPRATGKARLRLSDVRGAALELAGKMMPSGKAGTTQVAAWDQRHPLRCFFEGLRDRLLVYFEVRNLNHKPKLVAVTSCGKGAGVSSVAGGLAASLSETGGGKVLLVDMNLEQAAAQQFFKGTPDCGLEEALRSETMESAMVQANLYFATERTDNDKLPAALPRRFASLMPKLRASDYDYIIFDMPQVSQTSATARLAGFMDMTVLIIESEKTRQEVVKHASALLAESKANVCAVLNKTRSYIPARLHQEFLDDT
ncbi:MAG: hypothetical protein HY298_23435 [Verrucomicrobia bacterium]|nr:hypothetical protein [Verrucomicrobiota bacterium]